MFARGLANLHQAFSNRNFKRFTTGNGVSLIGMWALRIGVGWQAWELTGSAFWVGLVAFADLFPTILVTPFAGAVADRRSRIAIVRVTQIVSIVLVTILALLTFADWLTIEVLLAIVLLNGLTMGFKQPSRMALTRALVRPADLPTAIAVNAIVFNLARFVGPSLAGVLIVTAGVEAVFLFDALSSLFFIIVIRGIHLPAPSAGPRQRGGLFDDVLQGVRYAASHPALGPVLALMLVMGLCMRAFVELLPVYSVDMLDSGAGGLAILSASIGVGAILAGLWLVQRPARLRPGQIILAGHVLSALSLAFLALSSSLSTAVIAATLSGFAIATAGITSQTLTQSIVDERLLGRIMSLYGVIFRVGPATGALLMGLAADAMGLQVPWLAGALIGVLACLWFSRRILAAEAVIRQAVPPRVAQGAD